MSEVLGKLDQVTQVFGYYAFAVYVAQKNSQRAAGVAQRGPAYSRTVLGVEGAQYEGCQTRDTANADPLKISGKLPQMELILAYRGRAKPLLFLEVLKKSRRLTLEGVVREVRTTATHVTRDRQSQHLSNRVTRAVSHLPASVGLTFASRTIVSLR